MAKKKEEKETGSTSPETSEGKEKIKVKEEPDRKESVSGRNRDTGREKEEEKEVEDKQEEPNPPAGGETKKTEKGKWYVVHTYAGHENKVTGTLKQKIKASGFEDKIFDVLVPTQEKIEIREGKKATIKEKIFPGYILVHMDLDNQSWYAVRSTPGVTGFVGMGNKPTPLDEKEVATIQQFSKLEAPTYKATFSIGEAIKIIDGPFADFIGSVDNIDEDKGKLRVLVSIFGRETPVELDFLQVSKL